MKQRGSGSGGLEYKMDAGRNEARRLLWGLAGVYVSRIHLQRSKQASWFELLMKTLESG